MWILSIHASLYCSAEGEDGACACASHYQSVKAPASCLSLQRGTKSRDAVWSDEESSTCSATAGPPRGFSLVLAQLTCRERWRELCYIPVRGMIVTAVWTWHTSGLYDRTGSLPEVDRGHWSTQLRAEVGGWLRELFCCSLSRLVMSSLYEVNSM